MMKTAKGLVLLAAGLFAACSSTNTSATHGTTSGDMDETTSGGTSNVTTGGITGDFCAQYATACQMPQTFVDACHTKCAGGDASQADFGHTQCGFDACGVETGYCEGDETNDASIAACEVKHGWHGPPGDPTKVDFCQAFATQCKAPQSKLDKCNTQCANGDASKASFMSPLVCGFVACEVETGWCDNEEPGNDPAISTCEMAHGWSSD